MRHWIEIHDGGEARSVPLARGLTRVGGPSADVSVEGWTDDGELHFWDDPPRAVSVGLSAPPAFDGAPREEGELSEGTRIQCGSVEIRYHREAAVLEEIALDADRAAASNAAPGAAGPGPGAGPPAWPLAEGARPADVAPRVTDAIAVAEALREPPPARGPDPLRVPRWLWAGLLAEQGLAPSLETKRWQDSILRREFDADACARDLLKHSPPNLSDERLVQRGERLMRDLVMAPLASGARGAGKRARGAAKGGAAFVIANLIAITVYTIVILVIFLLVRVKWRYSFDGLFDSILDLGAR